MASDVWLDHCAEDISRLGIDRIDSGVEQLKTDSRIEDRDQQGLVEVVCGRRVQKKREICKSNFRAVNLK